MILDEYLTTVFHGQPPASGWPSTFHIITAFNPKRIATDAENNAADTRLVCQLQEQQIPHFRITGCSADLQHQEASWGVVGLSFEEAIALGQRYVQNAIFEVIAGEAFVVSCDTLERKSIGDFQARLTSVERESPALIFLSSASETTISHPFRETRLWSPQTADRLCISPTDQASLSKFRVSAISMVLFITLRGIHEAFLRNFQQEFRSREGLLSVMKKSVALFDALVGEEVKSAERLPNYADANYFSRWRFRYEKQAIAPDAHPLRPTTLTMFLSQATFEFETEPRVKTTDTAILAQGEEVYDNYVIGLRNHFGREILR